MTVIISINLRFYNQISKNYASINVKSHLQVKNYLRP